MPEVEQHARAYRFGAFELEARTGDLRKFGVRIQLQEQPRQILLLLLEHAGEIVSREQIRTRLWPDKTFVDFDNAINSAVRKLRDALGDAAEAPRYVETLARRGYRFIAPLSPHEVREVERRPEATARPTQQWKWKLAAASAIGVGVAALALTFADMSGHRHRADIRVTPLTANVGRELQPAFSPDGTRIAYSWSVPHQQPAIYVKLNGPGDPVRMSKDLPRVFSPAWSPDGRWIAAMQDQGRTGVIVLIPAAGGQPRQLARVIKADPSADTCAHSDFPFICGIASFGSVLAWSPDGKYLFTSAKAAAGSPSAIVRVSAESGEIEPLTAPDPAFAGDFGPAVSPDGQQLAFARFRSIRTGDLYVLPLSPAASVATTPKRITADGADIHTPAWMPDSRQLVFSSDRGGQRGLWRVVATGGTPSRVLGMGEDALDVAVSKDGRTLVYNRGHYAGSLWKIPIAGGKGGEPVRVTATTARDKYSQFSPDGHRIAFQSGRSGVDEIWTCDADGANALQLTNFGRGISGSPRWSPDGRKIAFDSNVGGSFDIYVIPSEGGRPLQLTKHPSTDAVPTWSRDGRWIYFSSWRTGRVEVWKVPADGGSEIQVTRDGGGLATESADGKSLYFVRGGEDSGDLYRMPTSGGEAIKVVSGISGRLFTVFPKGIYFAAGFPRAELRYLDLATGSVRAITPLPGMPHADISPDEKWVLYPQPEISDMNIMVVANFR